MELVDDILVAFRDGEIDAEETVELIKDRIMDTQQFIHGNERIARLKRVLIGEHGVVPRFDP